MSPSSRLLTVLVRCVQACARTLALRHAHRHAWLKAPRR